MTRGAAQKLLAHLIGSLVVGGRPVTGRFAGPWCDLADSLSSEITACNVGPLRELLRQITVEAAMLTGAQKAAAGRAASRLAKAALDKTSELRPLLSLAIKGVCETFDADPVASAALLRSVIEPTRLGEYADDLGVLPEHIDQIANVDPALAAELFVAMFTCPPPPDEEQEPPQSHLLPITFMRKNSFEAVLAAMAEHFPTFLAAHPRHAVPAMLRALEEFVENEIVTSTDAQCAEEHSVSFGDVVVRVRSDYSFIWDENDVYEHQPAVQMFAAFKAHFQAVVADVARRTEARQLLQLLVAENHQASVWRFLLAAAAKHPETFGILMKPLLYAPEILLDMDTGVPARDALVALFPYLSQKERRAIEKLILALPEEVDAPDEETKERVRNRLLMRLPRGLLQSAAARRLADTLAAQASAERSHPPLLPATDEQPSTEEVIEQYVRQKSGVDMTVASNQAIEAARQPVAKFVWNHMNKLPALEEVSRLMPQLRVLFGIVQQTTAVAVDRDPADAAHPSLVADAASDLAEVIGKTLQVHLERGSKPSEDDLRFFREVLLELAKHPEPLFSAADNTRFDDQLMLSGRPRAKVAAALMLLVGADSAEIELADAITTLSRDDVASVRYEIVSHLILLRDRASDLMWQISAERSGDDPSAAVMYGLARHTFPELARIDHARVMPLLERIYRRSGARTRGADPRGQALVLLFGLYVWHDEQAAGRIVLEVASAPDLNSPEASKMVGAMRPLLTVGAAELPASADEHGARRRTLDVMTRLASSAADVWEELNRVHPGAKFDDLSPGEQERVKGVLTVAELLAREVYYASGAYREKKANAADEDKRLPAGQRERFLRESQPLFDALQRIPRREVVHHLVQTLESFLDAHPKQVFDRIGALVIAGAAGGYQHEMLAANLIVRIIERYLAAHPRMFHEHPSMRTKLIQILDAFVGWPAALRLTYQLPEVFR